MNLIRAFTEHPASVGESYGEHLFRAVCFGTRMMGAGLACVLHGVLPFLFVRTGSRTRRLSTMRSLSSEIARLPQISGEKRLPL